MDADPRHVAGDIAQAQHLLILDLFFRDDREGLGHIDQGRGGLGREDALLDFVILGLRPLTGDLEFFHNRDSIGKIAGGAVD